MVHVKGRGEEEGSSRQNEWLVQKPRPGHRNALHVPVQQWNEGADAGQSILYPPPLGSIPGLGRSCGEGHGYLLGARVRYSAHGKGHEEGGSTYAKAGSNLRSPPGTPRASTPITRACLLYYFVLLPTPLTLRGAVPHHLFRRRS